MMVFQGVDDGRGYRNKHKTPRGSEMNHESKPLTELYNIAKPTSGQWAIVGTVPALYSATV